jgi:hypothetical protein
MQESYVVTLSESCSFTIMPYIISIQQPQGRCNPFAIAPNVMGLRSETNVSKGHVKEQKKMPPQVKTNNF